MILAALANVRSLKIGRPRYSQVDSISTADLPVKGWAVASPPEVHYYLLSLQYINVEIVCSAAVHKIVHLLSVFRLVVVGDQSNHSSIICTHHCMTAQYLTEQSYVRSVYSRWLRIHPCGEPVLSVMVEDEMPWNFTHCDVYVKKREGYWTMAIHAFYS